ncbi:predicted protein [Uncinocarpus reesii 1704]|uniref:DNA recombination and repair protein Rad51-like C-terminal domain-containing protein n=1 Tax=Uncinocarpus reesii (strain UAMH 1704) TaxID=336963 RepID=C4JWT4_UNCRE|nr:uncharacterized protein UREG_06107 [Uncinocarpus reesii 1704]EEP81242.1 predicted protein [Uncinocarpus reesii 1704]
MGAEAFGAKLLADVDSESLSSILDEFRKSHAEDAIERTLVGIKPIDHALSVLAASGSLRGKPVVEITSPSSADGKTSLLYYAAALAVLPAHLDLELSLGGQGAAVIWLDTDGRFDVLRFKQVMLGIAEESIKTAHCGSGEAETPIDGAVSYSVFEEALRHVHIFRPQSSAALLATLESLPEYILHTQHHSRWRRIHAVIVDSASAFYWQDWREAEISRIPGAREEAEAQLQPSTATGHRAHIHRGIISCLHSLRKRFSCSILYATAGLYPARSPPFKPYLPHPWPIFPTVRFAVRRDPVRPFADGMTVDEAGVDASARQEIVQRVYLQASEESHA